MYGQRQVPLYNPIDANNVRWGGSTVGRDTGMEMQKWHGHFDQREQQQYQQAAARQAELDNMARQRHQQEMANVEFQRKMQEQQAKQQAENSSQRNKAIQTLAMGFGNYGGQYGGYGHGFGPFRQSLMG